MNQIQKTSPPNARFIAIVLLGFVVGAALSLGRVVVGADGELETPLGYTVSLVLWLIPLLAIFLWFRRYAPQGFEKRAFWTTTVILLVVSFVLEFFWGTSFFEFENREAVTGIDIPSLGGCIPIEEYLFYIGGFLCILLLYIWFDETWLSAYNVPDYDELRRELGIHRVLSLHHASLWIGATLVLGSILYKWYGAPASYRDGFPGYFTYIIAVSIVPSVALYKSVRAFVNWRAFSLTLCVLLLVSLLWEVTLGIPFAWWGYQEKHMMGWTITAWSDLPIEAVVVWFAAAFTTVVFYEAVKLWQAMECPMLQSIPRGVQQKLEWMYSDDDSHDST